MAGRYQGLVWTQQTSPTSPGARLTDMEQTNSYSGGAQGAISLRDIVCVKEGHIKLTFHFGADLFLFFYAIVVYSNLFLID